MNVIFARFTKTGIKEFSQDFRFVPRIVDGKRYIYLMKDLDTGFFKIGVSRNPYKRLLTVSTAIHPVILIHYAEGSKEQEQALHAALKEFSVGGEWFNFTDEALAKALTQFMPPNEPEYEDVLDAKHEFEQTSIHWINRLQ